MPSDAHQAAFSWLTKEIAYLFKDDHFTDEELRLLEVNGTTSEHLHLWSMALPVGEIC